MTKAGRWIHCVTVTPFGDDLDKVVVWYWAENRLHSVVVHLDGSWPVTRADWNVPTGRVSLQNGQNILFPLVGVVPPETCIYRLC
jgi:hypothetical protein